jgi:hypothetical protein
LVSPTYAARKHQVPTAAGVNDGEVAVTPVNGTEPPTAVPPVAQPPAVLKGPHSKKLTVPVGVGPPWLPLTVAWSVFEPPSGIVGEVGVLFVLELAGVAVKHSVLLPSADAV